MFISKSLRALVVVVLLQIPLAGRDILLEFKGAYFHPTHSTFRKIYKDAALYGPEVTFKLSNCEDWQQWYGFASVAFVSKEGRSIGLENQTKVRLIPLALGLKYFVPFCSGNFYVGLGFQFTHLHTTNSSPFVANHTSAWGLGGVTKMGTFFDLPHNFLIDLYVDYSFVNVGRNDNVQAPAGRVIPLKTNISGVIVGAGLGYRF